jgi:hypothetical protein
LDETEAVFEERLKRFGDFSRINSVWSRSNSSETHSRLEADPSEWHHYHEEYSRVRESWDVVPVRELIKWFNQREGLVIGDFGCGQAEFQAALDGRHEVLSFDHVAINDGVLACDMANTGQDNDSLDAVMFCLSLMGSNRNDYLREANRCLTEARPSSRI